jgi:hypothetical protein
MARDMTTPAWPVVEISPEFLGDRLAAVEAEARAGALADVRAEVEAMVWFEPGSDGCERHQVNWDWGPDDYAHLERAGVLAVLDRMAAR